jgi:hypothetical protein
MFPRQSAGTVSFCYAWVRPQYSGGVNKTRDKNLWEINPVPGESVQAHGYRQSERLIQIRAKEMRRARSLTYQLQEHLAGAKPYTKDEIRAIRYERYILLHKLLIFMDISHENTISRMQRPRESCKKCYHNDPRVQLYCDDCYRFLNILL